MRRLSLLVLLLGCLSLGGPALADSITFDYNSGIADTMVANFWANTDLSNQPSMYTLASGNWESQSLIRFDSLFGSGTGQIPLGSTINNATLRLYLYGVQNPTQVLGVYNITTNWAGSSTWNSLGGGITPGVNAESGAAATATNLAVGWLGIDVASSLQAWADGSLPNQGWAILAETSPWASALFLSSDYGIASFRPTLSVDYTTPSAGAPEPGTLLLVGSAALAALGLRRRRRRRA